MSKDHNDIKAAYAAAKEACKRDWRSNEAAQALFNIASISLRFLDSKCSIVPLVSKVPGKEYFSFRKNGEHGVISRPGNCALFNRDVSQVEQHWHDWQADILSSNDLARMLYTFSLAPCMAMELFGRQNKKGPATYFECLIGHIFSKSLGINPVKKARLDVEGRSVRLTMDFLFKLNDDQQVHLPVKMSTRERVVQAWAHQRLLDGAYGKGTYKGIMVLFSETKLDSRTHEVVEICVPNQWLAYQVLLSQMSRIYYFDLPGRYQDLTNDYPKVIQIKKIETFFGEYQDVLSSSS